MNCIWNSRNEIKCSKDRTHGLFTKASSETASVEGWLSGRWRKGWGVSHYTRTDWKSVSAGLMSQIWSISQKLKSANEDVIGWFLPHVVKKLLCLTCGPFPLAAIFPYVPFTCSPSGFADVLCFAVPFLRLVFVFANSLSGRASSLSSVMSSSWSHLLIGDFCFCETVVLSWFSLHVEDVLFDSC